MWNEQDEELKKLKGANAEFTDRRVVLERNVNQKGQRVEALEKLETELRSQLILETQRAADFKFDYEVLVRVLKNHDYRGCHCQIRMVPEVAKARNHVCELKLGKKPEKKIEKILAE